MTDAKKINEVMAGTAPKKTASPKRRKWGSKLTLRLLARAISVLCIAISVGAIFMTGLFIFGRLHDVSGEYFRLSENDRRTAESIDLERLDRLTDRIADKNQLDAPREGRLNNPFLDPQLKLTAPIAETEEETEDVTKPPETN